MTELIDERETDLRKRKLRQIRHALQAGDNAGALPAWADPSAREADGHLLLDELDRFRSDRDLDRFVAMMSAHSTDADFKQRFPGFSFGVAQFVAQLRNASGDESLVADLLVECLEVPVDEDAAGSAIRRLMRHVDSVRSGAAPAPRSASTTLSFFWWLQSPDRWPFLRPHVEQSLKRLGWLPSELPTDALYLTYRRVVQSLLDDSTMTEIALTWSNEHQWIGLDPTLIERLEWATSLNDMRVDDEYPVGVGGVARANVSSLLGDMRTLGDTALDATADALGRNLTRHIANEYWVKSKGLFRARVWVKWRLRDAAGWTESPAIMLMAGSDGVMIGFYPGRRGRRWGQHVRSAIDTMKPPDFSFLNLWASTGEPSENDTGEYLVGCMYPGTDALDRADLVDDIERIAAAAQPMFDHVVSLAAGGAEPNPDPRGVGNGADVLNDRLAAVAEECLLPDTSFVDELVDLLRDKRQIVLYGPPGTGKTYIARQLAAALAPDESRRRFVQFHPSTSYEDFFEGYRPATDASGNLSYELRSGPFASLADAASVDGSLHVLVIDELNRANVPKVFGELLFLLEYRDQAVTPLYRPGFSLPENVWIIATMNTADRSIAQLDAALRRRFHFVPVFPDEGPMEGILDRFLDRSGGDRRWAALVAMVNADLLERIGSGDLLIGPSHFMKDGLDEALMSRIWHYNVEPLIDDLFYGDRAAINRFHWPNVIERFRDEADPTAEELLPTPAADAPDTDDVESAGSERAPS